jgi:exodeoxyribonuclease V alpha subunit
MMIRALLQQACERGEIRLLDLHIGLFLEKLAGQGETGPESIPELLLAGTLVSAAVGNGHVCLPLDRVTELPRRFDRSLLPHPDSWRRTLLATPVVGSPGETTPLVLDDRGRLYLYRFFRYEEEIAHDLRARATAGTEVDVQAARQLLAQLFPDRHEISDQQMAAALALLKPLLIISGGPGTGKTHTVARILALIQALNMLFKINKNPLRIALAAPTGKAAARLEESIRKAKQSIPPELARDIPEQARTLHRLLGYHPGADDFRYTAKNPLHLDLLVLDEASMIDVVLMAALCRALPATSRLILLGDRNQLASVEAGSLFADLCGSGEPAWSASLCDHVGQLTGAAASTGAVPSSGAVPSTTPMADSVVLLRTSYRFSDKSGIGSLAAAVNNGSMPEVDSVLAADFPDLEINYLTGTGRDHWLREQIIQGFRSMVCAPSVEQALEAMENFRFLCATRRGAAGVDGINHLAEQVLRRAGLIGRDRDWYQGKPIIIRRNQYEMELYNGDTGILWNDQDGLLRAWFRRPDNSLYPVTPARLPDHDPAYAITIHKAQGSEFNQVLLLLPEKESRLLSRELVYTGITRARTRLTLCCSREILARAVRQRTQRHSGLADKLWGSGTPGQTTDWPDR